jgi:hypothetical protein
MRVVPISLAACLFLGASAQVMLSPGRVSERMRNFDWRPDDQPLACSVAQIKPALNYGFRFQAGYTVRVPMSQYRGKGHRWVILMRVTPEGGAPAYFASRYVLPDVPKTSVEVEVGGGYLLGEGKYRVAWKMQDETNRICRHEWTLEARRRHGERQVKVAMAPNTVGDFSNWTVARLDHPDDAPPIRLTVLMHAAPTFPGRTRMTARDRVLLMGTLSSLMERLPTRSVRLVVFNLDQQRELFRRDDFAAPAFAEAAHSLDGLELGLVDYHVLQNRRGHIEMLADLVRQEVDAPQPSDVVLFLGPLARYVEKIPDEKLEKPTGLLPRFFYFQYRPFVHLQSSLPDVIHSAVSKLKGKVVVISSPGDFAKGIAQLERLAR